MPDPNLPPLLLTEVCVSPVPFAQRLNCLQEYISHIHAMMPELPHTTRTRLQTQYGLSERDVDVLMAVNAGRGVGYDGEVGGGAVRYFETLCRAGGKDAKVVVNW
jgi:aspartyl-tRNA(Asn)/glutamyl-tRNA(Gln) amidotransferase subunit B